MADPRIAFFDHLAEQWDVSEQNPLEIIERMEQHAELIDLQSGISLLEVGGVIATDLLPMDNQWKKWLNLAGLRLTKIIDDQELFYLQADVYPDE